jgi:hypothetical protein
LVVGIAFIVLSIYSLAIPGGMKMEPEVVVFGLFTVNVLHSVGHFVFGAWGTLSSRSYASARVYGLYGGTASVLLAVVGLFVPAIGSIVLGGPMVWLHGVPGLLLVAAALTSSAPVPAPAS